MPAWHLPRACFCLQRTALVGRQVVLCTCGRPTTMRPTLGGPFPLLRPCADGPCHPHVALCHRRNSLLAIPRGTTAKYVRAQPPPTVPPPGRPPSPPPTPPAPSVASLPPAAWWAVASDGSGKVLAAINQGDDALFSDPGDIVISRDAAGSWSNCSGAGRRPWNSIAIAANGGLLLASHDGPGSLHTSSDGSTWTAVATQHGALAWVATAASSDGQRLAAAVDSGAVYTSPDRVSCSEGTTPGRAVALGRGAACELLFRAHSAASPPIAFCE